jgi:hypothetical protein
VPPFSIKLILATLNISFKNSVVWYKLVYPQQQPACGTFFFLFLYWVLLASKTLLFPRERIPVESTILCFPSQKSKTVKPLKLYINKIKNA